MGKDFDIATSLSSQLPHFCCSNVMLDNKFQKDISQYLYCKEFGIPPFPGHYGMQPYKWINKANVIKNAMAKREQRMNRKAQREAEVKQGGG